MRGLLPYSPGFRTPSALAWLGVGVIFQFPYRTVAEVSLSALIKNLYTLRNLSRCEVIPVIKADAYGHGMVPVARALIARGSIQMVAVATLEEAMELRRRVPHAISILVLSGFLPHQVEAYNRYHLVPMIHCPSHLKSLLRLTTVPEIHLKLDTGMNRLGIRPDQLPEAFDVLRELNIKLSGLATHFAESEVSASSSADEQLALFCEMHQAFVGRGLLNTDARIHVANSGAILRGKLGPSIAIRPGLALYGIAPNPVNADNDQLVPVMEWKTRILAIKDLKAGDSVGYGRTYTATQDERLAILPIGYADGYPRLLSNLGEVLLADRRCPVRGVVSMDLTTVDVTHIKGAKQGDLVTLFGRSRKKSIGVWELAHWSRTIAYEILCGISNRVPRVYLE